MTAMLFAILDNRFEWVNTDNTRTCMREGHGDYHADWHRQTWTHEQYSWLNGAEGNSPSEPKWETDCR